MIKGILYVLTLLLLLLQKLVPGMFHGLAVLYDPLLETSEHGANAMLCDAEVQHHHTVD
jgi:hypothetical protein